MEAVECCEEDDGVGDGVAAGLTGVGDCFGLGAAGGFPGLGKREAAVAEVEGGTTGAGSAGGALEAAPGTGIGPNPRNKG